MKHFPLLGIMNGRLSKPRHGKIQSFPFETWQNEFELAREVGFDAIEMIFDHESYEENPLFSEVGLDKIRASSALTGVKVLSVCADFFMMMPLHKGDATETEKNFTILNQLIHNCHEIGVKDIVLPCVDQSTVSTEKEETRLSRYLRKIHPVLERTGIRLAIESDYSPFHLKGFITGLDLPHITINYDSGNSSALGYDVTEEIRCYGKFVSSVHIKDRLLHGTTVKLGTGNTDFKTFLTELKAANYSGPFIIQAARGEDEWRDTSEQLRFTKNLLAKYFL